MPVWILTNSFSEVNRLEASSTQPNRSEARFPDQDEVRSRVAALAATTPTSPSSTLHESVTQIPEASSDASMQSCGHSDLVAAMARHQGRDGVSDFPDACGQKTGSEGTRWVIPSTHDGTDEETAGLAAISRSDAVYDPSGRHEGAATANDFVGDLNAPAASKTTPAQTEERADETCRAGGLNVEPVARWGKGYPIRLRDETDGTGSTTPVSCQSPDETAAFGAYANASQTVQPAPTIAGIGRRLIYKFSRWT